MFLIHLRPGVGRTRARTLRVQPRPDVVATESSNNEADRFDSPVHASPALQRLLSLAGEFDRQPPSFSTPLVEVWEQACAEAVAEGHGEPLADLVCQLIAYSERSREDLGTPVHPLPVAYPFRWVLPNAMVAQLCRSFLQSLERTARPWLTDVEMEAIFWFAITWASSSLYRDALLAKVIGSTEAGGPEGRAASPSETLSALKALAPSPKEYSELKLRLRNEAKSIEPAQSSSLRKRHRPSWQKKLSRRLLNLLVAPLIARPTPLLNRVVARFSPRTLFGLPSVRRFLREETRRQPGSLTRFDVAVALQSAGMRDPRLLKALLKAEHLWGERPGRVLDVVGSWTDPTSQQANLLRQIEERLHGA